MLPWEDVQTLWNDPDSVSAQQLLDVYNAGGFYYPGGSCDQKCMLLSYSDYGFKPTKAVPAIGIALFALSFVIHFVQMCYSRIWWMSVILPGNILEVIGWAGRLQGATNPFDDGNFTMQICCLIIAPVFYSALIYTMLAHVVKTFARPYCRLGPQALIATFVVFDIISLVIQAVGGGMAATATDSTPGTNTMVAGVFFQLFGLACFIVIGLDVAWNLYRNKPATTWLLRRKLPADEPVEPVPPLTLRWKIYVVSIVASVVLLLLRCIYRCIELLDGWHGDLLTHEVYLETLDGLPMLILVFSLNVLHPVIALGVQPSLGRGRVVLYWLTCTLCGSRHPRIADKSAAVADGLGNEDGLVGNADGEQPKGSEFNPIYDPQQAPDVQDLAAVRFNDAKA